MSPADRLELDCLRAYVAAHRWLGPVAFARYKQLAEREASEALVARVLEQHQQETPPNAETK